MDANDLLVTLDAWIDARAELKKCYESCDRSPGYYCHSAAVEEEKRRVAFGNALNAIIDSRIAALTGAC